MEQDSEFSHIDTAISSLIPSVSSSKESELPNSLPVPLLADFGHFEKQINECILVESKDKNKDTADYADTVSETGENVSHSKSKTTNNEILDGDDQTENFVYGDMTLPSKFL